MWTVDCYSYETDKEFTKTFDDYIKFKNFIRKCEYSKKIVVISYGRIY